MGACKSGVHEGLRQPWVPVETCVPCAPSPHALGQEEQKLWDRMTECKLLFDGLSLGTGHGFDSGLTTALWGIYCVLLLQSRKYAWRSLNDPESPASSR